MIDVPQTTSFDAVPGANDAIAPAPQPLPSAGRAEWLSLYNINATSRIYLSHSSCFLQSAIRITRPSLAIRLDSVYKVDIWT